MLDEGFMRARDARRSNSKLAYVCLVTPKGVSKEWRLTHAFIARKEAECETLQVTIATLRREVQHQIPVSKMDRSDA